MASLQAELDEEEDEVCPVCLVEPVSVACDPCGHQLCVECLTLWKQTSASYYAATKNGPDANKTSCPMCRCNIKGFKRVDKDTRKAGGKGNSENRMISRRHTGDVTAVDVNEQEDNHGDGGGSGARKKASRGQRMRLKKKAAAANGNSRGDSDAAAAASAAASQRAPIIVWFRQDLRLRDNPALYAASTQGVPIVPVFVWCPDEEGNWPLGGAARYWLHQALDKLAANLQRRYGSRLILRDAAASASSSSAEVILDIAKECGARAVYVNRVYEPWKVTRDAAAEARFASAGLSYRSFNGVVLYEPWDANPDATDEACWNSGYGSVRFFLRACAPLGEPDPPLPAPTRLVGFGGGGGVSSSASASAIEWPRSLTLDALGLAILPRKRGRVIDWAAGIRQAWRFGEEGALEALEEFLLEGLDRFDKKHHQDGSGGGRGPEAKRGGPAPTTERFRADMRTTARISPYMRFGELSPREVYHGAKRAAAEKERSSSRSAAVFLRRLAWRDLAYWSLWRFPHLADEPLRPQYAHQWWAVPWDPRPPAKRTKKKTTATGGKTTNDEDGGGCRDGRGDSTLAALAVTRRRWDSFMTASDDKNLRAWQRGETGYPLVDAAMRELWITGYIPNYMRHVVAGFLIEYLSIDWRHGELWFHDTLVDADVAIQAFMWQNGGHSGMDQWNFVMHPVFAAKSADPEGDYVRRWCPELKSLPREYIHCPWEAPATMLARAGVAFGRDYPRRIVVNLDEARRTSLRAVLEVRRGVGAKYVLPDGNEALPLPEPGRTARCITRVDYRAMSEEPLTKQTAAAPWDPSRRARRDPLSMALDEAAALSEKRHASAMSVLG